MKLRLAVFGETGQLAKALERSSHLHGHNALFLSREKCDLAASNNYIKNIVHGLPEVDAVIIAAAYTAVDAAETDREMAFRVNENAPKIIAQACAERGTPLVHISTDYVFDGLSEIPYTPQHLTKPINVYGASKWAGEQGVLNSHCRAAILRTSWVYDGVSKNFMTTMLRLAQTHKHLNVVEDQIGRPTYAGHLAEAVLATAAGLAANTHNCEGVFHVSNTGYAISWADFAKAIFSHAKAPKNNTTIIPIPSRDYPTPAARPAFSVMDVSKFQNMFNFSLPLWQDGLTAALNEYNSVI